MTMRDELLRRRKEQPFRPFLISLKDGRQLHVDRRLQFAFGEDEGVVLDDSKGIQHFKLADITEMSVGENVN